MSIEPELGLPSSAVRRAIWAFVLGAIGGLGALAGLILRGTVAEATWMWCSLAVAITTALGATTSGVIHSRKVCVARSHRRALRRLVAGVGGRLLGDVAQARAWRDACWRDHLDVQVPVGARRRLALVDLHGVTGLIDLRLAERTEGGVEPTLCIRVPTGRLLVDPNELPTKVWASIAFELRVLANHGLWVHLGRGGLVATASERLCARIGRDPGTLVELGPALERLFGLAHALVHCVAQPHTERDRTHGAAR